MAMTSDVAVFVGVLVVLSVDTLVMNSASAASLSDTVDAATTANPQLPPTVRKFARFRFFSSMKLIHVLPIICNFLKKTSLVACLENLFLSNTISLLCVVSLRDHVHVSFD